jgi:hypothetical protein
LIYATAAKLRSGRVKPRGEHPMFIIVLEHLFSGRLVFEVDIAVFNLGLEL